MKNGFIFAGKSTQEFGMLVERCPIHRGAARKRTAISIPGRNGKLHYDEGSYENYNQPYKCGFRGNKSTAEHAHAIKAWLLSSGASQRLEDSYDPDYYRLATFSGPVDIENVLNKLGKCTITFDCDPRFFLKAGEHPIDLASSGSLRNPTTQAAKPLITIYGSGAGTVTVGNGVITVKEISDQITLDCETGNAYRKVGDGAAENMNRCILALVPPELVPGDNPVSWTGGITRLEIIPRWWML